MVVNTTAVDRGLGTGGLHVVHCNLSAPERAETGAGHIMAVRYMSEQLDTGSWEEHGAGAEELPDLSGVRVALCVLHSHVAALAIGVRHALGASAEGGLAYVMSDQAALPLALSDNVAAFRRRGLFDITISAGQAFGGDLEAVTVASGVHAAASAGHPRVVVGAGPGHVGTGTALGFSALEMAGHGSVLARLGAEVALVVRASSADPRDRHSGVSHHTRTLARLMPAGVVIPLPNGWDLAPEWLAGTLVEPVALNPIDLRRALADMGLTVETMGRSIGDDDQAMAALGAAAAWLANGPH